MIRNARCLLAGFFGAVLFAPSYVQAGGLLGSATQWVGDRSGLKPIQQVGQAMDQINGDAKQLIRPYGWLETQSSALVRQQFLRACGVVYQSVTQGVIAYCSNHTGRMGSRDKISEGQTALENIGLFLHDEFRGVDIRVCPLSRGTEGIAPDRGVIYVDPDGVGSDPVKLGSLIAHEMTHIRQYRRDGTDKFKCEYSQAYVDCTFCQSDKNKYEREAYAKEREAQTKLISYYANAPAQNAFPASRASVAESEAPSFNAPTGRVTIVNQANQPLRFWLESDSRQETNLMLLPGQWAIYDGEITDRNFNLGLLTEDAHARVVRGYGLQAGGTYYIAYTQSGFVDAYTDPQDHASALLGSLTENEGTESLLGTRYIDAGSGVLVEEVAEDSPAQEISLKPGDLILTVAGHPVRSKNFEAVLKDHAGEEIHIRMIRSNRRIDLHPTLKDME